MRMFTSRSLILLLILQVGCASNSWSLTKKSTKRTDKATAEFQAARQLETDEKYEQARTEYKKLLEKNPDNPEYLHRMGVVCTRLQRDGEARSYYERARQHDPKNVGLLTDMGYSAYIRGNYIEAERFLRDALKLKPNDKRATSNLALVLGSRGKTEESLALLRSVGDEASALAGLAYIHAKKGQFELAEQRYREALKTNPNFKEAADALAKLEKQRPARESQSAVVQLATIDKKDVAEEQSASSDFEETSIASFEEEISSEPAGIVQVGTVAKSSKKSVATAGFFEETSLEFDATDTKASVKLQATTFSESDDANSFDDELTTSKIQTASASVEAQSTATTWDDDWSDEPQPQPQAQSKPQAQPPVVKAKVTQPIEFEELKVEIDVEEKAAPVKKIPLRKPAPRLPKDIRTLLESTPQDAAALEADTDEIPELSEEVEPSAAASKSDGGEKFEIPKRRRAKSVAEQLLELDR